MDRGEILKRLCRICVVVVVVFVLATTYKVFIKDLFLARTPMLSFEENFADDRISIKDSGKEKQKSYQKADDVSLPVDINSAAVEELLSLPGIGVRRAEAIVGERKAMGGFSTKSDVLCCPGIGEEVFKEIEEYICALPYKKKSDIR